MSVEATIKTVLEADATLLALATGGIYSFDETGRRGIARGVTAVADAFDSSGIVQPSILVSERQITPDLSLQDNSNQYMSARQVCEVYCYADEDYGTIEAMRDRVYVLIHAKQLSGMFRCEWAGTVRGPRDTEIDAWVEREDYLCIIKRSAS